MYYYRNREEAAGLPAEKLAEFKGGNPLILAIPRGAAPMARLIAAQLGGELDIVLVRKLRAPDTINKVDRYADRVTCLQTPADFYAVGQTGLLTRNSFHPVCTHPGSCRTWLPFRVS